jgi:uncharacterized protein (DUF1810 family)
VDYNLERFMEAQDALFERVKKELEDGDKQSHWMWFVFPQIKGLGFSPTAQYYAIESVAEAKAYLQHPVLGDRLMTCCRILLQLQDKTAGQIFGYTDAMKLKSSMTLFLAASDNPVFQQVLDTYYDGQKDGRTLALINSESI